MHVEARPLTVDLPTPAAALGRADDLLDLLLTVGHADGAIGPRAVAFVRRYVESLAATAAELAGGSAGSRAWMRDAQVAHFDTRVTQLTADLAALLRRTGLAGAPAALEARATAQFRALPPTEQALALELVRALVHADGTVTPEEHALYGALTRYFTPPPATGPTVRTLSDAAGAGAATRPLVVEAPVVRPLTALAHPLLEPLEQTWSPHPVELQSQLAMDYQLVQRALEVWRARRAPTRGLLTGITDVGQIPPGAQFLDGHVHVLRPRKPVELVVLGDLHGCYACLKAALLQSDFVNRVWAHQWDPRHYPDVKLVLLGDYIDRGRWSFDGVLRAVLHLLVAMPDHVYLLRGNHEHFVTTHTGDVVSVVHPAEALATLAPLAPRELLEAYRVLFEEMPTSLLVDRTLFVHGGIPRDDALAARYRDLGSLDDPELRFQMAWSDPLPVDRVATEHQRTQVRFGFGHAQFRAFMERVGCHTLIRGHEQIAEGFRVAYDLGDRLLLDLFSAGGGDNRDLPLDSSYRAVQPMALTIHHGDGAVRATPWPIDYPAFNSEVHNGLYRPAPLLPYRYG